LFVVAERPSKLEDISGKPFYSQLGQRVRQILAAQYNGPVSYEYAVKCATGIKKVTDQHINACRPYTARSYHRAAPKRIICFGSEAAFSVLGRRISSAHVRRAYGWANGEFGPVPVFVLPGLRPGLFDNRFHRAALEEDIAWALKLNPEPWFTDSMTCLVETPEDSKKAIKRLSKCPHVTYDVETYGRMHNADFKITAATFKGVGADKSYTWTEEALRNGECRAQLKKYLVRASAVTQNGKYDDRSCVLTFGVAPEVHYDTRLGRKLLEPMALAKLEILAETVGMGGHKKEAAAKNAAIKKELNRLAFPLGELTKTGKKRPPPAPPKLDVPERVLKDLRLGIEPEAYMFGYLDPKTRYRYNARDVWSTEAVFLQDAPRLLAHPTISRVWNLVVRDASKAVRRIEHWGIPVDRQAINNLSAYCLKGLDDLSAKMRQYTDINPASPIQLSKFLYDELGLPCKFTTPSGARSTDEAALEHLKTKHPYVSLLLENRKLAKFNSTYAMGIMRRLCDDGRVHASFLLDGAETGRLSSQEPNLQNIPRAKGSVLGTMARNCFVASHQDWELLELDFSQLELRIAAMLSGDKAMIEDFRNGIDIHMNGATVCCEVVWKIPRAKWDDMTKDERDPYRSQIKTTIFGKLYGKTDRGLAAEFGVHESVVHKINKLIWGRYNVLDAYMEGLKREAARTGVSRTWWAGDYARERPLWDIADRDDGRRAHAQNAAGNGPVQGTAAEFMTASLSPIVQWIDDNCIPAELVSVVHDSVILNVHKAYTRDTCSAVDAIMRSHDSKGVPLKTDAKRGPAWGSMEDYKVAA
jgi:uracil-DNA glycosylase family 4